MIEAWGFPLTVRAGDLERRFGACDVGSKTCQFAQAYAIAHEIGHHLQNQLGLLTEVQQKQRAVGQAEGNSLQVRVELQADCLAGVWANRAQAKWQFRPSETIGCSAKHKAMSCRTHSLTAPQHNVRVGS